MRSRVLPCWVQLAVYERAEPQHAWVRHIRRIDEPRAEHRRAVAILATQIRAVPVLEVVADRIVVGDAVAGHMVERLCRGDPARRTTDHNGKLALVVHERDACRAARVTAMADERPRSLQENERLFLRTEGELFA